MAIADGPVVRKRWYTRLMDLYRYGPVRLPFLARPIRRVFAWKAERDVRRVAATPLEPGAIEAWLEAHDPFFGFALFRSGSTFLADFLNESLPDHVVLHEANVNDYWFYARALGDPDSAGPYVRGYRLKETVLRTRPWAFERYGEINPFLRRHCAALREALPGAFTFHLVRDGRSVVRSLMSREILDATDPMGPLVRPPPGDPILERWDAMPRFERICWLWAADNRFMRENTDRSVRFERLTADYDYFRERLLKPLGFEIPEATWRRFCDRPKNPTPRQRVPRFQDWPTEWKRAFDRLCGEEMLACGYGDSASAAR